jgi:hypothetical protein
MAKVQTTCVEGINCRASDTKRSGRSCNPPGGGSRGRGFRTCWGPNARHPNPTIERRTASGWTVVTGPLKPAEPSAQWGAVWLSPDRRWLVAEWEYPCDSAAVVFVPARGGKARIATGEKDWRKAPVARALGWTRDGKARVQTYRPWHGRPPGVYLLDPTRPAGDAHPSAKTGC